MKCAAMIAPLKWHGGKHYLAKKILALAPPHIHYVEPFAGGLHVMLAKDPQGTSEVANDLNRQLTNFWNVLSEPELFTRFFRAVQATPFSQEVYANAAEELRTSVSESYSVPGSWLAVCFFIVCRQSLAGRMNGFTGITKTRTRRGMNNEVSAWLSAVDGLPEVHSRLRRILITNEDFAKCLRRNDGPNTWFYCDPPYLQDTRTAPSVYAHKMTLDDHFRLLKVLQTIRGRFALSGYRNDHYDEWARASNWKRHEFSILRLDEKESAPAADVEGAYPNSAAGGKSKRVMTECVWTNY